MGLAVSTNTDEPWRVLLSRRLTSLTAAMTSLGLIPIAFGTIEVRIRIIYAIVSMLLIAFLLWLGREKTSNYIRSTGVVAAFAIISISAFSTLGFLSAPGVAAACSVAFSGLLLGRRAMLVTTLLISVCVVVAATLMVRGVLPAPHFSGISPSLARPWIRAMCITLLLVVTLGAAVTWVVETIESALVQVDVEAKRRHDAEILVQRAQSTELVGQLAASLAHDVNNQLTVISAWSALITKAPTRVDLNEASEAMTESIANATTLTRRLLMLGRRDAATPQAIDLRQFLLGNEKILGALFRTDIDLRIVADEEAWCEMDKAHLHQVLLNLAVNAQGAMPDGGTLEIEAKCLPNTSGLGRSGPIPKGDWSVLAVTDSGTGMDAEVLSQAFEAFFTTKPIGQGTGLGLATIAAIVERAGGHLAVDSKPGRGTRIEVWLPTIDAGTADIPKAPDAAVRLPGIRVLFVEDTPRVLEASSRILVESGADVVAAADGNAALDRIRGGHFDILCTDIVMPGVPVAEVIEAFHLANPGAKALLCSGYVDQERIRQEIEAGHYAFLAKPYTPAALISAIAELASVAGS